MNVSSCHGSIRDFGGDFRNGGFFFKDSFPDAGENIKYKIIYYLLFVICANLCQIKSNASQQ